MLFDDLDFHLARPDANTNYYQNSINQAMYRILYDNNKGVSLQILTPDKDRKDKPFRPSRLNESEWLSFADKTKEKILKYRKYLPQSNELERTDLICCHIPRNTTFYARIQQILYHPHKLKNFNDWEDYIGQFLDVIDLNKDMNTANQFNLINSEMEQIKRGDIPYFTFNIKSKDLCADNNVVIHDFFEETGKSTIQRKLQELNVADAEEIRNILAEKYVARN